MSIGTSYTVPLQTKRDQPHRQQPVYLPREGVVFSGQGSHDSVRFGHATAKTEALPTYTIKDEAGVEHTYTYRKNNVWVSTEDPDAKKGGLGEVTATIPAATAVYSTPEGQTALRDMRVITPFVMSMRQKNDERIRNGDPHYFKRTNLSFPVKINTTETQFHVLQKWEPIAGEAKKGYWRYALESEIFDNVDKIDTYEAYDPKSKALLIPFNRGAAKLIHYLKQNTQEESGKKLPAPKAGEEELQVFEGNQINVIGNDHLSGPVLYQPEISHDSDIRKGFGYHNIYDSAVPAPEAAYDRGYEVPSNMTDTDMYSPLTLASRVADWSFINKNFAKTIVKTDFAKGEIYVRPLRDHMRAGTVFDIHHPLDPAYTPTNNQFLRRNQSDEKPLVDPPRNYQFVELNKEKDWVAFKQANKVALQNKYGLNEDKQAVLMSWAARLEPNQKGFYMVLNSIEDLLKKPGNEKLQIVIAGNVGDPEKFSLKQKKMDAWIKAFNQKVSEDPALKGRVYFPNRFVDKDEITQMNAGSDFTILPSMYEPYGITQLEAYKMGSIPLVHSVDGIRSTVSDPEIQEAAPDFITRDAIREGQPEDAQEKVWQYDQTGVLMNPVPVAAYRKALARNELIAGFKHKVLKAPGKKYIPEGNPEEIKAEFRPLKKMLGELSADERLDYSEDEKTQMKQLKARLKKAQPVLTESDFAVLRIIRKKDKALVVKPANDSFQDAVNRAMTLAQDRVAMTRVRENGRNFLRENHSLAAIGQRWRSILDSEKTKPGENLAFGAPTFEKPMPPEAPTAASIEDSSGARKRKPIVVKQESTGLFQGSWQSISSMLSVLTFYLNPINWFRRSKPLT